MKSREIKVLGVAVMFAVTETASEFNTLAKAAPGVDVCHEIAVKNVLYHGSFGQIRSKVSELLEEDGHGKRKLYTGKSSDKPNEKNLVTKTINKADPTKPEEKDSIVYTDVKGKVIDTEKVDIQVESDKDFFDRVCAEKGVQPIHFKDLVQKAADAKPFDPSKKERGTGEKKIAKIYLDTASEIFAAGAQADVVKTLEGLLGRVIDISDESTRVENLARAVSDNEAAERAKVNLADKYKKLA